MAVRKHWCLIALIISLLLAVACARKENPEEKKLRTLSAQILQHEDERSFGSSEYWQKLLLENPDPELWERAILALGRIGDARALPLLRALVLSPTGATERRHSVAIRQMTAFAIGEIEDKATLDSLGLTTDITAVPLLLPLLNDPSLIVRGRAAEALGKIGDQQAVPFLLEQLPNPHKELSPEESDYTGLLLAALFRLQDSACIDRVAKLAQSPDPDVRWQTANALYRLLLKNPDGKTEPTRTALLPLLRDPIAQVRAHAVRALGATRDESLAGAIAPRLNDHSYAVQVETANAMGRLKASAGVKPLLDKWNNLERALRQNPEGKLKNLQMVVVQALGDIGDKQAVNVLSKIRFRPDPVSYAAEVALAKILKRDHAFFGVVPAGEEQPGLEETATREYLRHFTTPEGLRACATALGEHQSDEAQNVLLSLLREEPNPDRSKLIAKAKPTILNALVKNPTVNLEDILLEQFKDRDEVVRRTAADGLRTLAEKNAASAKAPTALSEAYATAAKDTTADARRAIITALGRFGAHKTALLTLTAALVDRERNVRVSAARALKEITGADYSGYLGKADTRNSETVYAIARVEEERNTIATLQTERGEIDIKLFRRAAPLTVRNFVKLAHAGFFDNLTFMRVVPDFVIQGGDPRNDQEGGPGYTIRCEINEKSFVRGSVGMALDGKDTGGSQFFLCLSPQPHLDGGYTNFGQVIGGIEVAESISPGDRILNVSILEVTSKWDRR